jgi:streptogrisin C
MSRILGVRTTAIASAACLAVLAVTGHGHAATGDRAPDTPSIRPPAEPASTDRLDRIMLTLDDWSRRHGPGNVQGWRVDPRSNSVVVTLTAGDRDLAATRLVDRAKRFGDSVRFESRPAQARVAPAEAIYGGLGYFHDGNRTCSVGFNARDSANRPVFLTAGHCVRSSPTLARNGYVLGITRAYRYGGQDWGIVENAYPRFWTSYAAVFAGRSTMAVRGAWSSPPVGTRVCKSGLATGLTCGSIVSTNVTAVYEHGVTIRGLVAHTACTEPGDSGGAVVSTGGYAVGMASGGRFYRTGDGRRVCGQRLGYPNLGLYQPIVPVLRDNGLRLLVAR